MHVLFYLFDFFLLLFVCFLLDFEFFFFLFEGVGAFLLQLRTVVNRLLGGIGASNINTCPCCWGCAVAGLSMPLLKVLVN